MHLRRALVLWSTMSKRTLTSSPSTPKKAKTSVGQSSLDHFFFSGSPRNVTAGSSKKGKEKARVECQDTELSKTHEVIDVDLFQEQKPTEKRTLFSPVFKAGILAEGQPPAVAKAMPTYLSKTLVVETVYQSLSVDPLIFTLDDKPWPHNTSAPYSFLSHTLATLSETRSRILILNTLTNC